MHVVQSSAPDPIPSRHTGESEPSMLESERNACLRLLQEMAGHPVEIVRIESLGSDWAPVERLLLAGSDISSRIGPSVIVKTRRRGETGWGVDPANLATEYRALATLHNAGADVAPEPLAWDEQAGVLVMRDLAPSRSIEQVLFENDAEAATDALVSMATATGTMHAATAGATRETWNQTVVLDQDVWARWRSVVDAVVRLGFANPVLAEADVVAVASALDNDAWCALAQGDMTPNNALLDNDDTVHLIDFETAGLRHCLLDAAMFSLSFPQYGRWAALPVDVVDRVERAYRSALATGLALADDDQAYGEALATACLAWTLIRLERLEIIAGSDQEPEQAFRRRTQIVHTIESCLAVTDRVGAYPGLTEWLALMVTEMRRRWPEARSQPRRFPAFS